MNEDEQFIARCIALSEQSLEKGDAPFGSVIVKDGKIITESINNAAQKISDHAEILALHKASEELKTRDLSSCTIYSNVEPCPMCSFMIREYKIKKVVFALPSPYMGGISKWGVLKDKELTPLKPFFSTPPEVVGGIFEEEAQKVMKKAPLFWMFGSDARDRAPKE